MSTHHDLSPADLALVELANERVEEAKHELSQATAARHALWRKLVADGYSQSAVARGSGVIRQAIGWALSHPSEAELVDASPKKSR